MGKERRKKQGRLFTGWSDPKLNFSCHMRGGQLVKGLGLPSQPLRTQQTGIIIGVHHADSSPPTGMQLQTQAVRSDVNAVQINSFTRSASGKPERQSPSLRNRTTTNKCRWFHLCFFARRSPLRQGCQEVILQIGVGGKSLFKERFKQIMRTMGGSLKVSIPIAVVQLIDSICAHTEAVTIVSRSFQKRETPHLSSDHSFVIPNKAEREYHSEFCSTTQHQDWVLCIVFRQSFKITSTTYLPETTNSEGFAQIAKMAICFSKL